MSFFENLKKKKLEDKLKKKIIEVLNKPVSEVMSKYVISIQKNEKLSQAGQIIVGEKVSCVVVKDGDRPVGVVTERDFLKKAPLNKKELEELNVNYLMSPKLVTINPNTKVAEAVPILVKNNFRKLVVEKNGAMVGIVTQTDFVRLFDKFFDSLEVKTEDLLQVTQVMTKEVITTTKDTKFSDAKKLMSEKNIGSIIILEDKKIAGIITEYDVTASIVENPEKCQSSTVNELMISPVMTISDDTNIFEANRLMVVDNVRRLPITNNDELKGIITQTDMCRSIFYFLQATLWHINKKSLKYEPLEKREIEKRLI
ncbi:MAG: CBS domain-containing protein [Nanoarchaeota archaeon]|nr:CBS domain-containing protein [Nanoarchaeota archaeon]MBU1854683.1 CBS domain-containing protein [Nanoarchaeota archaeon]